MNIIEYKILVMARPELAEIIIGSLNNFDNIHVFETDSAKKAFEFIYSNMFFLAVIDQGMPGMDIYKIGTMIASHRDTHSTPMLLVHDQTISEQFFKDFNSLLIDSIKIPFENQQLAAKIRVFMEMFESKNAAAQGVEELNRVYSTIFAQQELDISRHESHKTIFNISAAAASQMQQPLRTIKGNTSYLINSNEVPAKFKSNLIALKTCSQKLVNISKRLRFSPEKIHKQMAVFSLEPDRKCRILIVENLNEDYDIFYHLLNNLLKCELIQARNNKSALEMLSTSLFDLIFINYKQTDGTGFDLLSRLNRLGSETPVIFTFNNTDITLGVKALSKGALDYIAKENLSEKNIITIIDTAFKKARLIKNVEEARGRILMLTEKEYLSKVCSRREFESSIQSEIVRSKRYKTPFSIVLAELKNIQEIIQESGKDTGDMIASAGGSLIKGMVRESDTVCRYGNSEFGIILPNTDMAGAGIFFQRILKKITEHQFEINSSSFQVVVDTGAASFDPDTDQTSADMISRALQNSPLTLS